MSGDKIRAVLVAVKKNARRELAILIAMVLFGLVVAVIAVPVILGLSFLPDWAFWSMFSAWITWMVLRDTIAAGVRAYRDEKP